MKRGPLGFPRLTSIGPLSYEQEIYDQNGIEEAMLEVFEEQDIDPDNYSDDEFIQTIFELSQKIYPNGGEVIRFSEDLIITEQELFLNCMGSEWNIEWSEGFIDSTTGDLGDLEQLVMRANGCIGITESRSINVIT